MQLEFAPRRPVKCLCSRWLPIETPNIQPEWQLRNFVPRSVWQLSPVLARPVSFRASFDLLIFPFDNKFVRGSSSDGV